ncbi:kinase-like domain-containing protein [Nemania sp. FL0031]|nr:kinase-like domain-containing protein [Nemania sp. FL0031]
MSSHMGTSSLRRDLESSIPFSEGHVELRLPESDENQEPTQDDNVKRRLLELSEHQGSIVPLLEGRVLLGSSHQQPDISINNVPTLRQSEGQSAYQSSTPICDLDTEHLDCRLLIQPHDLSNFTSEQGREELLRCRDSSPYSSDATIECIAVTQSREKASFTVVKPVPCELYYNSQDESITVRNNSWDRWIAVDWIFDSYTRQSTSRSVPIKPYGYYVVGLGAWTVRYHGSDGPHAFQFMVYPRRHSLMVLDTGTSLPGPSGFERKRGNVNGSIVHSVQTGPLIKRDIGDISNIRPGEIVRVSEGGMEEYRIHCLEAPSSSTRSSNVYKARVSTYPKELVVVKSPKAECGWFYGQTWEREYGFLKRLKCDVIVPLLGADARLNAIFLKAIDAYDLSHLNWCDKDTGFFKGTEKDALRVLTDMTKALEYLKNEGIVHHDIRPANILYGATGAILTNFSLARAKASGLYTNGTPWYIEPSYVSSGPKSRLLPEDVWALGITMIYLLRFIRLPESGKEVESWAIKEANNPGSEAQKSMHRWLEVVGAVVEKKLDKNNYVHNIVRQMLQVQPMIRIQPSMIRQALERGKYS